jgi:hypothetical protein
MNAPVGRRSVASAVVIAVIARWTLSVFPAMVTIYKGVELAP